MPCDQQSSKALRVLAGGDYIDEKKAGGRKDIRGLKGKSTCSSTSISNGSCEVRQYLRKPTPARSKTGQIIIRYSKLYGMRQEGYSEGRDLVNQ